LLHAQVVHTEDGANTRQKTALEAKESERRLIDLGLVDEFQLPAILLESIDVDKTTGRRGRADCHVFGSADNEECFVILARKLNCGKADGSLIVFEVKGMDYRLGGDRVHHLNARSPMSSASWVAKLCGWELSILAIATLRILDESLACSRGENIVVGFNNIEQGLLGMFHKAARSVR
jgi:hypothetical protein